jgi:HAD superfamily hydrolase (TIGR01490 family)
MSVHIFDVDYTLVKKTTSHYFIAEALSAGAISLWQLRAVPFEWLRYKLGRANQNFIEDAVKHLSGIDSHTLETLAENAFVHRMRAAVYPDAQRLIERVHRNGEPVHFATSSFYPLIRPLERYLGVTESIASSLEFAGGKTTGRITGTAPFGHNKKTVVQAWLAQRNIDPADVYFYSDSYTDLPLLDLCGHPVAVNPDPLLAREATQRKWTIMRFT